MREAPPRVTGWAAVSDRELVLAFQAGDEAAYTEIYRRYRPLAWKVCRRILGNPEDAEEAAQEAMLRVFQGLPQFNGRYLLKAWVARIATNVCLDTLRARARRPENGAHLEDLIRGEHLSGADGNGNGHNGHRNGNGHNGHELDVSDIIEQHAEAEAVTKVLDSLPAHHRAALVLREYEGFSHREIARALGISAPQAKSLIHRAKRSFRRAWDVGTNGRAATLLVWFLWPFHLLRRLFHKLTELPGDAGAAAASASTTIAPVAQTAVSTTVEKVTAAVAAVAVAGSIGIGVVRTKSNPQPPPDRAKKVAVVPAPAPPPVRATFTPEVVDPTPTGGKSSPVKRKAKERQETAAPADSPEASVAPAPQLDDSPTTDSPGPSTGTAPPPIPAAPAWGLGFQVVASSEATCRCLAEPWLISSATSGTAGKSVKFAQQTAGAALDGEGDPAWRFWMSYWGGATTLADADTTIGSIDLQFSLQTLLGEYRYQGLGRLVSFVKNADGTYTYLYQGSYRLVTADAPEEAPPPPTGVFTLALKWWMDGKTLYRSDFTLAAEEVPQQP